MLARAIHENEIDIHRRSTNSLSSPPQQNMKSSVDSKNMLDSATSFEAPRSPNIPISRKFLENQGDQIMSPTVFYR